MVYRFKGIVLTLGPIRNASDEVKLDVQATGHLRPATERFGDIN